MNGPSSLWRFSGLARDSRAGAMVTFAIAAPLLFAGVAAAIEATMWYQTRQKMRNIADSAALAAAREMSLANRDATLVAEIAKRYADAQLVAFGRNIPTVNVAVAQDKTTIAVTLSRTSEPIMGTLLPSLPGIQVSSTARVTGRTNVCVIGLDATASNTILMGKTSRMTADRCAIYSNSTSTNGITFRDAAFVRASLICSAGGQKLTGTPDVQPMPTVDCPKLTDPLATRPEPVLGACTYTNKVVSGATELLLPGTYCGGLTITKGAVVTLAAGNYLIKGGMVRVTKSSSLKGTNVGFFLAADATTSTPAELRLEKDSIIELTAPKDGDLAGLIFFESRANPAVDHRITSDNARVLLGTIYLPAGSLFIDSERPVADLSAYTVIVARKLHLDAGPNLHLNTGYNLSDIPVPKGLGPIGGAVQLAN